jgi:photosystem II stability/assembly factor-like uncharacterized protein
MSRKLVLLAMVAALLVTVLLLWTGRDPPEQGWRLVLDRPVPGKYEDLAFPTAEDGWVVSAGGDILHTADAGAHWEVQASGLGHLRSMEMLDAHHGFAGTLDGVLYRTDDGGKTWVDVTDTLPVPPRGFCGMDHLGAAVHLVGRFAGGVADYYRSADRGRTWAHQDLSAQGAGLVEVVFLDSDVGLIGGRSNSDEPRRGQPLILRTSDGGETWKEVFRLDGGRGFVWKLFPTPDGTVHAALQTEDGALRTASSADGGETWVVHELERGRREAPGVQAIGFIDDDHGWTAGFFTGMYETRDGGSTWSRVPGPDRNINRFVRGAGGLVTASQRGVLVFRTSFGADAAGPGPAAGR